MDDDLKNSLVALLDSNFGYTGEEKAEVAAERIMRYLRDAGVVKPVRCKDCIHKPHHKGTAVYADDPSDFTCPYLCSADPWAAGVPDDDFFCKKGVMDYGAYECRAFHSGGVDQACGKGRKGAKYSKCS